MKDHMVDLCTASYVSKIVNLNMSIERDIWKMYSGANWKVYKYCFMRQKCQLQMGKAHYKNAAKPLWTRGINTTHQHFQMKYIILFQLKELKAISQSEM